MIVVAVVLCCLALFILLCKSLEDTISRVIAWATAWQRRTDERISTLEDHDYAQDARLDKQQDTLKSVKGELKEMGKDVGWSDDNRKTQVMKLEDRDSLLDIGKKKDD
jgi:hypothetical protein